MDILRHPGGARRRTGRRNQRHHAQGKQYSSRRGLRSDVQQGRDERLSACPASLRSERDIQRQYRRGVAAVPAQRGTTPATSSPASGSACRWSRTRSFCSAHSRRSGRTKSARSLIIRLLPHLPATYSLARAARFVRSEHADRLHQPAGGCGGWVQGPSLRFCTGPGPASVRRDTPQRRRCPRTLQSKRQHQPDRF